MARTYREYLLQIVPTWLRGRYGGGLMESLGVMLDAQGEGARQAILARLIDEAPWDALPLAASERQLERHPIDDDASWRYRLVRAWQYWCWAGTRRGLTTALLWTGYFAAISIHSASEWGGLADPWTHYWIVVQGHPWASDGKWGDPGTWGDGGTWGSTATIEDVERVKRIVRLWQPAEAYCAGVILLLSGELWGSGGLWGDPGTWGAAAVIWKPEES